MPAYCVLVAGLVGLSWIDLRTKRLPREIIYVTARIGVPLLWSPRSWSTSRSGSG